MTDKLDTPKIGDLLCIRWPGSATGDNRKWAKLARETTTRIGVNVAAVTPAGEYTGALGAEVRWFVRSEIVPKLSLLDVPEALRPALSERQATALGRAERRAERKSGETTP